MVCAATICHSTRKTVRTLGLAQSSCISASIQCLCLLHIKFSLLCKPWFSMDMTLVLLAAMHLRIGSACIKYSYTVRRALQLSLAFTVLCITAQSHKHTCTRMCTCRPATRPNDRIYFRLGDVVGGSSQPVPLNAEVSFIMVPDPRGNQDRAANVQVLADEAAGDQFNTLSGKPFAAEHARQCIRAASQSINCECLRARHQAGQSTIILQASQNNRCVLRSISQLQRHAYCCECCRHYP